MTTRDLLTLTKFRLSALVIVTTFVGFWLRAPKGFDLWLLFHTIVGSTLAAFGAAVFNPVSYTHLDVYKRQLHGHEHGQPPASGLFA